MLIIFGPSGQPKLARNRLHVVDVVNGVAEHGPSFAEPFGLTEEEIAASLAYAEEHPEIFQRAAELEAELDAFSTPVTYSARSVS